MGGGEQGSKGIDGFDQDHCVRGGDDRRRFRNLDRLHWFWSCGIWEYLDMTRMILMLICLMIPCVELLQL